MVLLYAKKVLMCLRASLRTLLCLSIGGLLLLSCSRQLNAASDCRRGRQHLSSIWHVNSQLSRMHLFVPHPPLFYDVKTETPTKLKFAAAAAGRGEQRSAGLASQKMDAAPFLQQLSGAHPVEQEEESRQDQGLC